MGQPGSQQAIFLEDLVHGGRAEDHGQEQRAEDNRRRWQEVDAFGFLDAKHRFRFGRPIESRWPLAGFGVRVGEHRAGILKRPIAPPLGIHHRRDPSARPVARTPPPIAPSRFAGPRDPSIPRRSPLRQDRAASGKVLPHTEHPPPRASVPYPQSNMRFSRRLRRKDGPANPPGTARARVRGGGLPILMVTTALFLFALLPIHQPPAACGPVAVWQASATPEECRLLPLHDVGDLFPREVAEENVEEEGEDEVLPCRTRRALVENRPPAALGDPHQSPLPSPPGSQHCLQRAPPRP